MADSALFIGWGEIVRGRERNGPKLFDEAVQYFGQLQQGGRIEGFEPWFMERHGGDVGVTTAYTGADLQRQLEMFGESAGDLAG